jgi:hypothetical protein
MINRDKFHKFLTFFHFIAEQEGYLLNIMNLVRAIFNRSPLQSLTDVIPLN